MRTFAVTMLAACLPGAALAAGNSLTMWATSYDNATPRFPGGALSGGYGYGVLTSAASNSFTWETWAKLGAAPGASIVAVGSANAGSLGANAQGQETCSVATSSTTITGPSLLDGKWHLLDLVAGPSGFACYLDGAQVGTSPVVQMLPANATIGVATVQGNNIWTGEIDEASVWNVPRYTGSFTAPSVPYLGSESGLVALYHLNGNGVDFANDTVDVASDPSILYSPLNWSVVNGSATTNNAGAYFRTMFSGNACSMNFDVSTTIGPASEIYWRVDGYEAGQPWTRTTVTANMPCTPPSDLAAAPWHLLEVVVKSTSAAINRWVTTSPGVAVRLAGITLAPGAAVQKPIAKPWKVVLFGDSITEGVHTVNMTATYDTDQNDATMGWAYQLGNLLGAEVGVIGYSGSGLTVGAAGGVPPLTTSYNMLSSGVARVANTQPDLFVINEGTNDAANVTSAALTVLNGLIAQYPATPIALLVPFNQTHAAELQLAALTCNQPGLVHLVQTGGIENPADGIDIYLTHPLGPNNLGFIGPRLASLLMPILVGGPGSLSAAQLARIP